jgi:anti-anti-sigma factor
VLDPPAAPGAADPRFTADLERTLKPLEDPEETMRVVARLLGEHMRVDRSAYAEAEADEDHFTMTGSYARGLPPLTGRMAMSEFSADTLRCMREGVPYVLDDAETDPRVLPAQREIYHRTGIAAVICTPLHKGGRFVAAMAVHHATPRHWTADEVALLDAVVIRCWESLQRAHAHAAVREGEERYRLLAERATDGIWLADADGRYTDANPAACAMLGYTREEHLRLTIADVTHAQDHDRLDRLLTALRDGEPVTEVWQLRRRDGGTVPVELSMRFTGERLQAIGRDITERLRAEAERERLLRREQEANRQLGLLQRATAALSAAATPALVAKVALEQVRELLGECGVAVWERAGEEGLRSIAVDGWTDDRLTEGRTLTARPDGLLAGVRDAPLWLLEEGMPDGTAPGWAGRHTRVHGALRQRGYGSLGCLPLHAAGRAPGLLSVALPAGRVPSATERATAESLADQCAQALHRARLLEAEREIATVLQRSLLPRELPALARLSASARYTPSAEDAHAGGDWYDLLPLDGTRVALVIGDVVGHGPAAAAVMGQLRSALAGHLLDGRSPAAALERLDRFAAHVPGSTGSTCACLTYDWASGELRWSSAGHPPVLLLGAGGSRFLSGGAGTVLGAPARSRRPEGSEVLGPGSSLVLYTDGLVETRDEVLDAGLGRLAATVREHADLDPHALTEQIVAGVLGGYAPTDDVALLVVRTVPGPASGTLPAAPASLRGMRRAATAWLVGAGTPPETADDVQLTLGEAAANAVEHAYPEGGGEFTWSLAPAGDGSVEVTVTDSGRWRPVPADSGYRGHGLRVMRELGEALEITRGEDGTRVAFRVPPATTPTAPAGTLPHRPVTAVPADVTWRTDPAGEQVLVVTGDVDLVGREPVARALLPAARAGDGALVVDLAGVPYLSSAGIALLSEAAALRPELAVVVAAGSAPARALEVTGLAAVLAVRVTEPTS